VTVKVLPNTLRALGLWSKQNHSINNPEAYPQLYVDMVVGYPSLNNKTLLFRIDTKAQAMPMFVDTALAVIASVEGSIP